MRKLTILEKWWKSLGTKGPGKGWWGPLRGTHTPSGEGAPTTRSQEDIVNEAVEFVGTLIMSGGEVNIGDLSSEAREFLAQTVEKDTYKLYRGMGLVKWRVEPEHRAEINVLSPGDAVPEYLMKQHNVYASYTTKRSIARSYTEGRVSIITKATVSRDDVIVDTRNLHKVLSGTGQKRFDEYDFDYFKGEGEVIVREPVGAEVYSISGRLPL